ncbi:MAG: hypothetical protein HC803_06975 [Saprospiraceae bacterium]|nr:hypothetical protein [Saprospiraceae bacterium]
MVTGSIVVIDDKVAPTISNVASTNPTNCGVTDGTITITANGTGAVEYSINGGTTWSQSGTFIGLAGGTYQIRVRNIDESCEVSSANIILVQPTPPTIVTVTSNNPSDCDSTNGQISIGATFNPILGIEFSINGVTWQAGNTFTGLGAGTYNVFIRNGNGTCQVTYVNNPVVLTVPNAPTITNVASANPSNCGVMMVQLL